MSYPKFKEWNETDKDELINKLKRLEEEFSQLGYEIILHGGTLLGAIRENDLIEEDNDIDFLIFHKSTDKVLIKQEIIDIDNSFFQKQMLCKDLHYLGNNHYYIEQNHFDGWHCWLNEENKFYAFFHINGELVKEDIFPLIKVKLRNCEFNIPKNYTKFLTLMYGEGWQKKQSEKPKISSKVLYEFFQGQQYLFPNRKLTQKEILIKLSNLLNTNDITFWLQTGTLLGAIRDNNFIEWDEKDIDIGLHIKDYWKVKELLDISDFKYKWQWHKEIAVHVGDNVHPHIDLFFHTFDEQYAYCYSYKPNRISSIWNEEWRLKIPRNILEPLKPIKFLDIIFKVPNDCEKYLINLYGENWKIPDKKWQFKDFSSTDKEYRPITAIVTTYKRNEALKCLVNSFYKLYPDIKLLVGNQNTSPLHFNENNIEIINLPEDCGLSYARNELVKNVKTEFILLLEDDFIVTKQTDIYKMLEVFAYDKYLALIGGRLTEGNKIKAYEKFLFVMNDILISIDWNKLTNKNIIQQHKINRIEFGIADIIYNFFVARTDILRKYGWDNNHKVHSEHLDFFLNLKLNSNYKVAFIPEVTIEHNHVTSEDYELIRKRMYYDLIYKKYNIKMGYTLGENMCVNYKENRKEPL